MIHIKGINGISTKLLFLCDAACVLKGPTKIQNKQKMAKHTFNYRYLWKYPVQIKRFSDMINKQDVWLISPCLERGSVLGLAASSSGFNGAFLSMWFEAAKKKK